MQIPTIGKKDLMSVFSEEDSKTVKIIGIAGAGFFGLTVFLIILALYITS
jgi:hypothetical protein